MNPKHLDLRIRQCLVLAEASNCPRRKFGALLLDPLRNVVLADGYNGAPRGGSHLCGTDTVCERDRLGVASGTRMEVGCHHAEANVLCNAAANGTPTRGAVLVVTGEPCLMCAKLLHHAEVGEVVVVRGGYAGGTDGTDYLERHGVKVTYREGPRDPRASGSDENTPYEMT